MSAPTIEELQRQEAELVFPRFDEDVARAVGLALLEAAKAGAAPVVINIRTADRTLFHVALPGSAPNNDHWARRKSNTVLRFHYSSMLVGERTKAAGKSFGLEDGLDSSDFAAHGGSFPVRVANVGVVGAITVSGLSSAEDHAMIVGVLRELLKAG